MGIGNNLEGWFSITESPGDVRKQRYILALICKVGLFFSGDKCEANHLSSSGLGFPEGGERLIKGQCTELPQLKDRSVVEIMEMGYNLNIKKGR